MHNVWGYERAVVFPVMRLSGGPATTNLGRPARWWTASLQSGGPIRRLIQRQRLAQDRVDPRLPARPPSRSRASTSGSSRTLICSFVTTTFGRPGPRRTNRSPSNTSAFAIMASVSSGASSGSVRSDDPALFFARMDIPHRNDAPGVPAWRPDRNHPPPPQMSCRDIPILYIVAARVLDDHGQSSEHQPCVREVQPTLPSASR